MATLGELANALRGAKNLLRELNRIDEPNEEIIQVMNLLNIIAEELDNNNGDIGKGLNQLSSQKD